MLPLEDFIRDAFKNQANVRVQVVPAYRLTITLPRDVAPLHIPALTLDQIQPTETGLKEDLEKLDIRRILEHPCFDWEGATIEKVEGPFFQTL